VGAGLVLPWCNSATMGLHLAEISQAVAFAVGLFQQNRSFAAEYQHFAFELWSTERTLLAGSDTARCDAEPSGSNTTRSQPGLSHSLLKSRRGAAKSAS
jgi:hypothetical protein